MRKKSGIYKYNCKCFRYDYEHAIVEYVAKATAQERKKLKKSCWKVCRQARDTILGSFR